MVFVIITFPSTTSMKKKRGALLTIYQKNEGNKTEGRGKRDSIPNQAKSKQKKTETQLSYPIQEDSKLQIVINTTNPLSNSKVVINHPDEMQQCNTCIQKEIKETKKSQIGFFSEIDYHHSIKYNKMKQYEDICSWFKRIKKKE